MPDGVWRIRESGSGLDIALHVQPRARRSEISGTHGGALKLKVTAPPIDDAANQAVLAFFSALLHIPKACLKIVSGERSREKTLRINGISYNEFLAKLPPGLT